MKVSLDSAREILEPVLGRSLRASEESCVKDLLQVPSWVLDEARRLRGIQRHVYLGFVLDRGIQDRTDFIEEVLDRGLNPVAWGWGMAVVAKPSTATLLSEGAFAIKSRLLPFWNGRWFRLSPTLVERGPLVGEVIVVRPELDYRDNIEGESMFGMPLHNVVNLLEAVIDVDTAIRRWIAGSLADRADIPTTPEHCPTAETLIGHLVTLTKGVVPSQAVHDDLWIAARGLIRERDELAGDSELALGFRGPDEWYESR